MKQFFIVISLLSITCLTSGVYIQNPQQDSRFGLHDSVPVFQWNQLDETGNKGWLEFSVEEAFSDFVRIPIEGEEYDLGKIISLKEWKDLSFVVFWRITDASGSSEVRKLTKTRLVTPRVQFPLDARYDSRSDDEPYLIWEPISGATGYRLVFSVDPDFTEMVSMDIQGTSLDFSIEVPADVWSGFSGMFFFRVWALDEMGRDGPYYGQFRISKTLNGPPSVGRPAGQRFQARADFPGFVWGHVDGAVKYHLQIAHNGEWDLRSRSFESIQNALNLGDVMDREEWEMMWGVYRWRVCIEESSGALSPWSQTEIFTKHGARVIAGLGDSITTGGVCVPNSWLDNMEYRLNQSIGMVTILNRSIGGTKAIWGEEVIESVIRETMPEFILILFGANDAVDPGNCDPPYGCDVAGHLREMIRISRMYGVIPIISTVLPVNPEGWHSYHQFRVDSYNEEIRQMAEEEQVDLVDTNAAAWSYGYLPDLFCDWGHPNAIGTDLIAREFFEVLMTYDL